jgi:hypothetical protein
MTNRDRPHIWYKGGVWRSEWPGRFEWLPCPSYEAACWDAKSLWNDMLAERFGSHAELEFHTKEN